MDVSTAAYDDVDKFLQAVRAFHVGKLGHRVVGVVGDWQTFNRMWHLKNVVEGHDEDLDWLVPLPGEFHFTWHCAEAMYKLWWRNLLQWAATEANMMKSIKDPASMATTDNTKYIDHFFQLLIKAVTQYLFEVLGEEYLSVIPYDRLLREWEGKSLGQTTHSIIQ